MATIDKEEILEAVEHNLLSIMRGADAAVHNLSQKTDGYDLEISQLTAIKREVKTMLNKHFDALARMRKS